jgi:DNA-binding NtrC family response regulator
MKRDVAPASPAVLELLATQPWPGNVRQLEQVLRRAIIDSGGLRDADVVARTLRAIDPEVPRAATQEAPAQTNELVDLDEAERRHIASVLRATGGNQTQAAFILGIERKTLARKIKRLNITID